MKTKDVIEGFLYRVYSPEKAKNNLEICHIIDKKRNWEAKNHEELYFLDKFLDPSYLVIIDKQIHVYIIGEKAKGKSMHILNIEGFTAEYLNMSTTDLVERIKQTIKYESLQFLPESICQRLIFIQNYKNNNDIYIFNRIAETGNILRKAKWTLGIDKYRVDNEFETNLILILKIALKDAK